MTENSGINQTYTRVHNNSLVLKEIRKEEQSATNLAKTLSLSNASVSSIIKQLVEKNAIVVSRSESINNNGRKQVFYKLNDEFGLIVVVSLSNKIAKAVVSNINEEILIETSKNIELYDIKTIYEIILDLKSKIEESIYKNVSVKTVVISVPGRVNKQSGELQLSKQYDEDLFKTKGTFANIFKKYFMCDVFVYNDIYLSALSEVSKGNLKGINNGFLVYIDEGIGSSFILNSKQYRGELGYAGEIGLLHTSNDNKNEYLDDYVSLRSIKEKNDIKDTQTLIDEYFKNDSVKKCVNDSAIILGRALCDIQELLNFNTIVLSGRVIDFKEEYLNNVKSQLDKAFSKCNLVYASSDRDLDIKGGIELAIKKLFNEDSEICNK